MPVSQKLHLPRLFRWFPRNHCSIHLYAFVPLGGIFRFGVEKGVELAMLGAGADLFLLDPFGSDLET